MIGVEYSVRNIADQIKPLISKYGREYRFLVYCFRGGKRSRLRADSLRTIGFQVDVLAGGWKRYRQWVRESLETLPTHFKDRVLAGLAGCGKTRLLAALSARLNVHWIPSSTVKPSLRQASNAAASAAAYT